MVVLVVAVAYGEGRNSQTEVDVLRISWKGTTKIQKQLKQWLPASNDERSTLLFGQPPYSTTEKNTKVLTSIPFGVSLKIAPT